MPGSVAGFESNGHHAHAARRSGRSSSSRHSCSAREARSTRSSRQGWASAARATRMSAQTARHPPSKAELRDWSFFPIGVRQVGHCEAWRDERDWHAERGSTPTVADSTPHALHEWASLIASAFSMQCRQNTSPLQGRSPRVRLHQSYNRFQACSYGDFGILRTENAGPLPHHSKVPASQEGTDGR